MQMNEMDMGGVQPVDGYGPGFFRVGGERFEGGVLVTLTGVQAWAGLDDRAQLLALAGEIDVLFIGTGAEIAHIPAHLRTALEAAEIGVETMASPSACRTYNVLLSEGRRVAAALLCV